MNTVIDKYGIDLIKKFEKLNLTPVKYINNLYIVGYGHITDDINKKITKEEAEELLKLDWLTAKDFVENPDYVPFTSQLNNYQVYALISFTMNCGSGSLKKLCTKRLFEIPNAMLAFIEVEGVPSEEAAKRRFAERNVFLHNYKLDMEHIKQIDQAMMNRLFNVKYENPYPIPTVSFSKIKCNTEQVKWLQTILKYLGYYKGSISGLFDAETVNSTKLFQKEYTLEPPNGVIELSTIEVLTKLVN